MKIEILLIAVCATTVLCRPPGGGRKGAPRGPPPGADGEKQGPGGNKRPPPPFLEGVDKEVGEKFKALMDDKDMSRADKQQKMLDLAEEVLNAEQMAKFKEGQKKMEQHHEEMDVVFEEATADLSDNAKTAAEEIRALYKNPDVSKKEVRDGKRAIIEKLSDDERKEMMMLKRKLHGGGKGGGRGPSKGKRGGMSFLKGVDKDVRQQFLALKKDKELSRADKKKKMQKLAANLLDGEQMDEFEKSQQKMEERYQKMDDTFEEAAADLSEKAKEAAEGIRALYKNMDLSQKEVRDGKRAIVEKLSDDERKELIKFKRQLYGGGNGGGRKAGGRRGKGSKDD